MTDKTNIYDKARERVIKSTQDSDELTARRDSEHVSKEVYTPNTPALLKPKHLSRIEKHFSNLTSRCAHPFYFDEGNLQFRLKFLQFGILPDISNPISIGFYIGSLPAILMLSTWPFTSGIGGDIDPEYFKEVPDTLKSAVAEAQLGPFLPKVSTILNATVTLNQNAITQILPIGSINVGVLLEERNGNPVHGILRTPPSGINYLTQATRHWPIPSIDRADNIPLHDALSIGKTAISLRDLKKLKPRDIILFDTCIALDSEEVELTIEKSLSVSIQKKEDNYIVTSINQNSGNNGSNNITEELDDLNVQLTFRVGQREISIKELRSLSPGYIFTLSDTKDTTVSLICNGQVIGEGELVETGNKTGVRVLNIFNES